MKTTTSAATMTIEDVRERLIKIAALCSATRPRQEIHAAIMDLRHDLDATTAAPLEVDDQEKVRLPGAVLRRKGRRGSAR